MNAGDVFGKFPRDIEMISPSTARTNNKRARRLLLKIVHSSDFGHIHKMRMINLVRSNSRRSLALFILLTMFLSIVFYTKPLVGNVISKGIFVWVPQNLSSA